VSVSSDLVAPEMVAKKVRRKVLKARRKARKAEEE